MSQRVPPQFITKLQGGEFVQYAGLLELAHQDGLSQTNTDILQFPMSSNGNTCIIKATVTTGKGTFTGIGDASPDNVNRMIAAHLIRMAETRAIARALRVATNVGMTAFEELGDVKESKESPPPKKPKAQPNHKATEGQKNDILAAAKKMDWTQVMMGDYLKGQGLKWKTLTFEQAKGLKAEIETMLGQMELAALAEQKGMKPHALTATCEKKFAKAPEELTLDEIQQVTKQLAQLEDAA